MATTDPVEWRLFDTDLVTTLGILPSKFSSHLYLELTSPGSGSVNIPLDSTIAAQVTSACFSQCRYRGAIRGGFFVENITKNQAGEAENAGRVLKLTGRGPLALLEDAIVWDDGTSATKREFATMPKAEVLITLIDEAQARGGLQLVTYDFTTLLDSDGNSWDDEVSLEFPVGKSLLDVSRELASLGFEFDINPDGSGGFVLSAYKNGIGTDKSSTVIFRIGMNCTEVGSAEAGGKIKNVVRVKYKEGFTTAKDAASIAARRRRETLFQAEYASNAQVALDFGQAELENVKTPEYSRTIIATDAVSPRLFEDYGIGDTIMLDDGETETPYRIRGLAADWDGENYSNVTLNINSIHYENLIKLNRQVDWLRDIWGTAHDAGLLNASFWAKLGQSGNNGTLRSFAILGTKLYIGGDFTRIGGIDAAGIVSYDLSTGAWDVLGTGLSGTVGGGQTSALALQVIGSTLYIGGNFSSAGGVAASCVASWNGTVFSALGSGLDLQCNALAAIGTDLYVGGNFTSAGGVANTSRIAKWNGAWSALGTGINGQGHALAVSGSTLFAVGAFTNAGGTSVNYIAQWSGSAWSALGTGLTGSGSGAVALTVCGDYLYAGGYFTTAGGISANRIARWHLTDLVWSALDDLGGLNNACLALANDGINIYAGGTFSTAGGVATGSIAKWNLGSWMALGGGISSGGVTTIIVYGLDIYAGGYFNLVEGVSAYYFSAYMTTFNSIVDYLERNGDSFDLAKAIHAATQKTPMVAADEMGYWDSVSKLLRKITFSNLIVSIQALMTYTANRILITTAAGILGVDAKFLYNAVTSVFIHGASSADLDVGATDNSEHHVGVDGTSVGRYTYVYSNTLDNSPFDTGVRAGGTKASPTKVLSGMVIRKWRGRGFYGTSISDISNTMGEIRMVADADWSSTSQPVRIEIWTTAVGSITLTLAMTIGSDGHINIPSGKEYRVNGAGIPYTSLTSRPTAETQTVDIYRCDTPGGISAFVGTIATLPGGAVLTYNVTSGQEGAMVPTSTSQLGKMRLYNPARGNYALISNCVVGTNTLTFTANVPGSWLVGDTITIASQTVSGGSVSWVDIEITSGPTGKSFMFLRLHLSSGTAGDTMWLHPFEAFATSKTSQMDAQVGNTAITYRYTDLVKITGNLFSMQWTGTPSKMIVREAGYLE